MIVVGFGLAVAVGTLLLALPVARSGQGSAPLETSPFTLTSAVTIVLMFIGGGSAGTAGGIKVTTFVVLLFVIIAEVRGERSARAFDRRIDPRVQRQALTVALLGVAAVVGSWLAVMLVTPSP